MTCSFPECDREAVYRTKGLCHGHYTQVRRGQQLQPLNNYKSTDPAVVTDRLMRRTVVEPGKGCWLWQGHVGTHGYGTVRSNRKHYQVHRLAYILLTGELPEGSVVHHKCGVKVCINPAHLQAVTPAENVAEGLERSSYKRRIRELEAQLAACRCEVAGE